MDFVLQLSQVQVRWNHILSEVKPHLAGLTTNTLEAAWVFTVINGKLELARVVSVQVHDKQQNNVL